MKHKCPAEECSTMVGSAILACPRHWYKVSPATRAAVNAHWHSGDLEAYVQARADAVREMNE